VQAVSGTAGWRAATQHVRGLTLAGQTESRLAPAAAGGPPPGPPHQTPPCSTTQYDGAQYSSEIQDGGRVQGEVSPEAAVGQQLHNFPAIRIRVGPTCFPTQRGP
jgi:hypothetical protein